MAAKSRIGPFALEAPISKRKSSGQVFRGIHLEQRKLVALRIFPIPMGLTPESRQAFAIQLEQLKQLRHPGIVRCYGGGFDGRIAYLAYELIDGESVTSLLSRRQRLAWETVLDFSQQMADALTYAHQSGWVHGRLGPSKLLVADGKQVKLTDWRRAAIASMIDSPRSVAQLHFTAPENLDGSPATEKSDLYSFGAVMYLMLTGSPPYAELDATQLAMHIQSAPVPSVGADVLDCPVWLSAIVAQLLAKDPRQRPYQASALQLALREAQRRNAEGAGVLQHATAGFSPLQMNVDRGEAEKLLGLKPNKKKRKPRESSFLESTWVLLAALVLALAAAVWFMLPLNEDALRSRAEGLLASEKWLDWNAARDRYLREMAERFPDGQHSSWATEKMEWVDAREAERRLDRGERLGRKDDWTEAQQQLSQARRYERFGDVTSAYDKYTAIVKLFSDAPDDRGLVLLAREGVQRLKGKTAGQNALEKFLENKLDDARAAEEAGRATDARDLLESIVELYADNQLVAPLVQQAQLLLEEITPK